MPVLVAQLLVVFLGAAFVCLVLIGLPGVWLALATAALCEWATAAELFHPLTLAAAVVLASLGELAELLASSRGARRAGASRGGARGALAGGIVGAVAGTILIPAPVLGTLAGGGLGAFLGASLAEHGSGRELRAALRVGRAAAVGHALGMVAKLAAGVAAWVVLAVGVLVP